MPRHQPLSPPSSDSSTPGQGRGEDTETRETSGDALAVEISPNDHNQIPVQNLWTDGLSTGDDMWFDHGTYGIRSSLGSMYPDSTSTMTFSPTETMNLGEGDNVEDLFDFTASAAQHYPCMDFLTSGDMVYDDLITHEASGRTTTNLYNTSEYQDLAMQANSEAIEDPMRKVSLVVDECDGNTWEYLTNVMKPLKGKVRFEVNL